MSDNKSFEERVFGIIDGILERRGLSWRRLSREGGRGVNFYRDARDRGDAATARELVEEVLGISPEAILAPLMRNLKYEDLLVAYGPQDDPRRPELLESFEGLEELVRESPQCRSGEVRAETWAALEELEFRRFRDPETVEEDCLRWIGKALSDNALGLDEAVLGLGALGTWCTLRRHANDRGSATRGLVLAIRISACLGIEKLSARLLQRAWYLLDDVDQSGPAELMAARAAELYTNAGDSAGLGTALIDMGFAAFSSRKLDRARSRLLLGVGLLGGRPLHDVYRASAFHSAAKCSSLQGELDEAVERLEEAAKYAGSSDRHWAAIKWCAGNVLFQRASFHEAEGALRQALKVLLDSGEVTDIVMILLDLATVYVAMERWQEIPVLAEHLRPYMERLPGRSQVRHYVEEAYACLVRARHSHALERFKEEYEAAWRSEFATP